MKITVVRIVESNGQTVRHEASREYSDPSLGMFYATLGDREKEEKEIVKRVASALFAALP